MEEIDFSKQNEFLVQLTTMKMPFGKYKGQILCNLPEPYLVWFKQKGFPSGKFAILSNAI